MDLIEDSIYMVHFIVGNKAYKNFPTHINPFQNHFSLPLATSYNSISEKKDEGLVCTTVNLNLWTEKIFAGLCCVLMSTTEKSSFSSTLYFSGRHCTQLLLSKPFYTITLFRAKACKKKLFQQNLFWLLVLEAGRAFKGRVCVKMYSCALP